MEREDEIRFEDKNNMLKKQICFLLRSTALYVIFSLNEVYDEVLCIYVTYGNWGLVTSKGKIV